MEIQTPLLKAVRVKNYSCICGFHLLAAGRHEQWVEKGYYTATCSNMACPQVAKPMRIPVEVETFLPDVVAYHPV